MALAGSTYIGRAKTAYDLKTGSTFWVGFGRTTAWDDEETPPDVTFSEDAIEEPFLYVKATYTSCCKPAETGDIEVAGQQYSFVADEDVLDELAYFMYALVELDYTEMTHGTFRQVGLFTNLVPQAGYENNLWLAAANVDDPGILRYICNKTAKPFIDEMREERIIIEVR